MRYKSHWIAVLSLSTLAIAVLLVCIRPASVRAERGDKDQPAATYDPYPAGILPSDLNSETARVLREIDRHREQGSCAMACPAAATLTGQPPILQDSGTEANGNPRRADALRQKHFAQQECGLRILSHALCRL